jgi:LEA14-like dessication related protein
MDKRDINRLLQRFPQMSHFTWSFVDSSRMFPQSSQNCIPITVTGSEYGVRMTKVVVGTYYVNQHLVKRVDSVGSLRSGVLPLLV